MTELPADITGYLTSRLQTALPRALLDVLKVTARAAAEQGWDTYIVGGWVRDALLDVYDVDVDVSVVGDALALARKVTEQSVTVLHVHDRFGTASLDVPGSATPLDIVTARKESYPYPGALPEVQPGSIEDDLARRDFTINALAARLVPGAISDVIDPHGGLKDLAFGIVRVLHDTSFIDDPTRVYRAVKLAARLGMSIAPQTLELALRAVRDGAFATISTDRAVNEIRLIMAEPRGHAMLAMLEKLGVLRATHPALSWPYEAGRMAPRDDAQLSAQERRDAYLAVMGAELATQPDEAETAARSLRLPAREIRVVSGAAQLVSAWQRLGDPGLQPSEIAALLRPIDVSALEAVARIEDLSGDSAAWNTLQDYLNRIRHVRTELGGDYLREMNVPEGPIYGRILGELLAAKLDGVVITREDEEQFVEDQLRRTAIDGSPARGGHEEGASQA